MSSAFDQDALDNLTPEERAAIESEEIVPGDDIPGLKALADGDDGDDDDGEDPAPAPSPAPAPAPAPADSPAPAPAPAQDNAEVPEGAKPFEYVAKLPDDFDARVTDLQTKSDDLAKQFKAGEIEFDEFQASSAALTAERDTLNALRVKAEMSNEMRAQSAEQQWQNTVSTFMASTAKAEGVDYRKDPTRAADLDTFVKLLAGKDENADKPMSWFLSEAHKRVNALHGVTAPAPADAPAPSPNRKPPIDAAPKNLSQVPGGDGPGDVGSEFAHLDGLDGDDLEHAIGKMSPAQREKYAKGA